MLDKHFQLEIRAVLDELATDLIIKYKGQPVYFVRVDDALLQKMFDDKEVLMATPLRLEL